MGLAQFVARLLLTRLSLEVMQALQASCQIKTHRNLPIHAVALHQMSLQKVLPIVTKEKLEILADLLNAGMLQLMLADLQEMQTR